VRQGAHVAPGFTSFQLTNKAGWVWMSFAAACFGPTRLLCMGGLLGLLGLHRAWSVPQEPQPRPPIKRRGALFELAARCGLRRNEIAFAAGRVVERPIGAALAWALLPGPWKSGVRAVISTGSEYSGQQQIG